MSLFEELMILVPAATAPSPAAPAAFKPEATTAVAALEQATTTVILKYY